MTVFSIPFSRGQQFKLVLFGALVIGVLATMAGRGTLGVELAGGAAVIDGVKDIYVGYRDHNNKIVIVGSMDGVKSVPAPPDATLVIV